MKKTTTIRVPADARDRLNELAGSWEAPADEVDDRALLAAAAEGWGRMSNDPPALAAHRAEASELQGFDAAPPDY